MSEEPDKGPVPLVPGPSDIDKPLAQGAAGAPGGGDPNAIDPSKSLAAKEAADKAIADAAAKKVVDDAEAKKKADELAALPTEYQDTGSEAGNAVVNKLKAAGVSVAQANEIFQPAIDSGDFTKIDWAKLKPLVSAEDFTLIQSGAKAFHQGDYADRVVVQNHAFQTLGGKEGWEKVKAWASTHEKAADTSAETKAEIEGIRQAINKGGYPAKLAVDRLKAIYEKQPGNSGLVVKMERGSSTATVHIGEPLGRADYMTAYKAANAKGDVAAMQVLDARRREGMKRGL